MATRALVLAGGGLTGIGWELGVLLGLRTGGIDPTDWDRIVGTSAGSVVGASLGISDGLDRLTANLRTVEPGALTVHEGSVDLAVVEAIGHLWYDVPLESGPDEAARMEIGRLAATFPADREAEFVGVVAAILPTTDWPATLLTTAVDITDGTLTTFDATSGVPLVLAVAASCAVPGVFPAVAVGERRYMDGGVGTATNARLAGGNDLVVVVAPVRPDTPPEHRYFAEVASLRASGSTVIEITLDDAAADIFGSDLVDVSRAQAAGVAGFRLGLAATASIRRA
jgi:NTE family protein